MFFAVDIVVDANTLEASPKEEKIALSKGVITSIEVKYAAGCHGYVKVRLFYHEGQLIPLSREEWLIGDDEAIPTDTYFEMTSTPYELKFVGISPDSEYAHTVTVRVTVLPKAVASVLEIVRVLERIYNRLFGR